MIYIIILTIIVLSFRVILLIDINKELQIKKEVKKYMKLPYTIELIPEEDGTYFVEVKELPGCMSEGDTPEEALAMIKEAMEGWIESNLERGLQIPLPNIK